MAPFEIEERSEMEIKPLDIAPGIDKELERLHNIVLSETADKDYKKWARDRIEHIHSLYMNAPIYLKKPNTKGKNK